MAQNDPDVMRAGLADVAAKLDAQAQARGAAGGALGGASAHDGPRRNRHRQSGRSRSPRS